MSTSDGPTFFRGIGWCSRILDDPAFAQRPTESRAPKTDTEDAFFASTLRTDDTIRHCTSLYRVPEADDAQGGAAGDLPIRELRMLLSLGSGLDGYAGVAHGGLTATLLDEIAGSLLSANRIHISQRALRAAKSADARRDAQALSQLNSVTGELTVRYVRPVPTPSVVLATAKVDRVEGRKTLIVATLEDGQGVILASARALFIRVSQQPGTGSDANM